MVASRRRWKLLPEPPATALELRRVRWASGDGGAAAGRVLKRKQRQSLDHVLHSTRSLTGRTQRRLNCLAVPGVEILSQAQVIQWPFELV